MVQDLTWTWNQQRVANRPGQSGGKGLKACHSAASVNLDAKTTVPICEVTRHFWSQSVSLEGDEDRTTGWMPAGAPRGAGEERPCTAESGPNTLESMPEDSTQDRPRRCPGEGSRVPRGVLHYGTTGERVQKPQTPSQRSRSTPTLTGQTGLGALPRGPECPRPREAHPAGRRGEGPPRAKL